MAKKAKLEKGAKKAKNAELKSTDLKKAKEAKLKAKKEKEEMLAELKAKKAMLAEVVQVSSDEDDSGDEDPTASTSTRSRASITSTRSRAPIASTSNAQAASMALRG
nr:hypothetical protein [Tanacetum cinerariifolium]